MSGRRRTALPASQTPAPRTPSQAEAAALFDAIFAAEDAGLPARISSAGMRRAEVALVTALDDATALRRELDAPRQTHAGELSRERERAEAAERECGRQHANYERALRESSRLALARDEAEADAAGLRSERDAALADAAGLRAVRDRLRANLRRSMDAMIDAPGMFGDDEAVEVLMLSALETLCLIEKPDAPGRFVIDAYIAFAHRKFPRSGARRLCNHLRAIGRAAELPALLSEFRATIEARLPVAAAEAATGRAGEGGASALRVALPVASPIYENPGCHSDDDGDCAWAECPQLRDGEPKATGRHCPRDMRGDG